MNSINDKIAKMIKKTVLQTANKYNQIAEQIIMPEDFYIHLTKSLGKLSSSDQLLDIGCGNGYLLKKIAQFNPQLKLFGLDFSQKLLENAQKRLKGEVELIKADAHTLPFEKEKFSIVIMSEVIEHLTDPVKSLSEVHRVLRKSGQFILTFPNASAYKPFYPLIKHFPQRKIRMIFTPPEDPQKTGQPIDKAYFYKEIVSLLKKTRFKILQTSGTIFFPYLGEIPILSSLIIFLWRKTCFDRILNKLIGPKLAYRVLIKAIPV